METIDQRVHQARSEYLDAAIAETQAVCNSIEASDERVEELLQIAQLAGDYAQQKFEAFVTIVAESKASKADEN